MALLDFLKKLFKGVAPGPAAETPVEEAPAQEQPVQPEAPEMPQ